MAQYNPPNVQNLTNGAIPVFITSSSGGAGSVARYAGTWTDHSGTVATANASQQLMAANATRKAWWIQNTSASAIFLNFTAAASTSAAGSVSLAAGATYTDPAEFVTTEQVNITSATAGATFVCKEGN